MKRQFLTPIMMHMHALLKIGCYGNNVYFLSFERSELEGKYAPIVLGRHSSTSTVSA